MTFSASGSFTCNICGEICARPAAIPGREEPGCDVCGSTIRVRGLIALLSREVFGSHIPLPHFPPLRSVRGFGMSDARSLAEKLAAKFDYTNTFYHQAPMLDITAPPEEEIGRNDFIISSEVMEHVPPPIERAFANLYRLLKPNGLLLLTVPYSLKPDVDEHYPELHEYDLASPGGRTMLVNRRRDGSIEFFEDLCFHGGHGSTLEMRLYSEASLKRLLLDAGFSEVRVAAESVPEFGVQHAETWSLPIVARKGRFQAPADEIAQAYGTVVREAGDLERDLLSVKGEYKRFITFHDAAHADYERQLAERFEWVSKAEGELAERTRWAQSLEAEKNEAVADFQKARSEASVVGERVKALERELEQTRAELAALQARLWTRLGKKVGGLD